ncbi:hypothetical protein Tco_0598489 [Tanacetum coccineum]
MESERYLLNYLGNITHNAFRGKIAELDEGQTGLDLGKTPESQPPLEQDLMEEDQAGSDPGLSHVARVGLNPEPMHDDFVATVYLSVNENLKHATEEQVHMEIPLSSSGTLSSMKNLDNFNFGDQFVNDNPTEEDSGKTDMETEVESMVTVSIRQASILVPHLSIPIIDLSPLKLVSSPLHEPFIATTTEATTTTLLLPPLP